jgi:NTP pyrophosphatase (non-canonical NTP hydrolase)
MKTAVQWLEEKLKESLGEDFDAVRGYFVMAKEMEKEQIMHAYGQGAADEAGEILDATKDSEEYYNKKYGGEK